MPVVVVLYACFKRILTVSHSLKKSKVLRVSGNPDIIFGQNTDGTVEKHIVL